MPEPVPRGGDETSQDRAEMPEVIALLVTTRSEDVR
jgi:hypothetical protein